MLFKHKKSTSQQAERPESLTEEIPANQQAQLDFSGQEAGGRESAQLHSRGRQILLFILPIIALFLVGILILLIVNMPQAKEIQLERYTQPNKDQKIQATQPRETRVAETSVPRATEAPSYRLVSRDISKENLSKLIRTGAGIPPGLQSSMVHLVDSPPELVWQPPEGSGVRLPAVVGDNQPPTRPDQEVADQENPDQEGLPTLPVQGQAASQDQTTTPPAADAPVVPPASESEVEAPQDNSVEEAPVQPQANPYDVITGSSFYATELPAYVYGELVNVRADASMEAEVLTEAHLGDEVYEIESNGSWSRVRLADGFEGYIFSSLLSYNYVAPNPTPPTEVVPEYVESDFSSYSGTLYSTFSGVNIRSLPSTDSEVVGNLYYGDSVTAVGYTGGWFQVLMNDGSTAYVHGDYLTEDPVVVEDISGEVIHEPVQHITSDIPEVETPSDLAGGNAIVGLAMQYQGYPYVYGAAGPSSFDCSGFTSYIYSQMGVGLGRTTYDQVNNGIPVSFSYKNYSNMVPGDLVLFATGAGIGHVGIYIGGGQFIHAANESVGVVVDSLNMDFWASSLAHVRRIFY